MSGEKSPLELFVEHVKTLKGDEKGEAQHFLDRLFKAFGHPGAKEAGATFEERIAKKGGGKRFADLVWKPRVLIEMKSRGEKLHQHTRQVFEYWERLVPGRVRYAVLCNFDEFWIYDFNLDVDEPVEKLKIEELPQRSGALAFLLPVEEKPVFGKNRVAVTQAAADQVAAVFNNLVKRGVEREVAQRFILQCVMAMFAQDLRLLPSDIFTRILDEAATSDRPEDTAFDHIQGLFQQMNSPKRAPAGRFAKVDYFNGGLFAKIDVVKLTKAEILNLQLAAAEDWSEVNPAIFGTLFQSSMDQEKRHAFGAHFTSEADIMKVVLPTIVRPWRERLRKAETIEELLAFRRELTHFHVLDPACGSGNFLYVAYRELKRIETDLLVRFGKFKRDKRARATVSDFVSSRQFHGLDIVEFAVELAKVTMLLAKELALVERQKVLSQLDLGLEAALPLENLNDNIKNEDSLLLETWPSVDAIIGNPPYQSKNKAQGELTRAYLNRIRTRYPEVPGRADLCVYFFRRAHDELAPGQRAGLVGTNTIRQNESREGSLQYIVGNGGTITEAVGTQEWSGDAAVYVSIVNWIKGTQKGPKRLTWQTEDKFWHEAALETISPALSTKLDLTSAQRIEVNAKTGGCFQGQTHGHEGFLLPRKEAEEVLRENRDSGQVLHPYMTVDELLGGKGIERYVIDFHPLDLFQAKRFKSLFERVQEMVLPARQKALAKELARNEEALAEDKNAKVNHHHENFYKRWWHLSFPRGEMKLAISRIPRFVVCGQVTKRPIFEFLARDIRPNAALMVFPFADDYTFGILQSSLHWEWFTETCSTLKGDPRYTSDTVFDTFPWPQTPLRKQVAAVAKASAELRRVRRDVMQLRGWGLRELYRAAELPGTNTLRDAQEALDEAVRDAYGMGKKAGVLKFLLDLNHACADREEKGETITEPGLPENLKLKAADFTTDDCVRL